MALTWPKSCVLTDITTQAARTAQGDNPARTVINATTVATFQITDTKLYVLVVILSTENDKTLLEQLKEHDLKELLNIINTGLLAS